MTEFLLTFSELFKQRMIELLQTARSQGRLNDAKTILREMVEAMQRDPLGNGEQVYHLKHSGWPILHLAKAPWSVHYAVDAANRVVYLSSIALME